MLPGSLRPPSLARRLAHGTHNACCLCRGPAGFSPPTLPYRPPSSNPLRPPQVKNALFSGNNFGSLLQLFKIAEHIVISDASFYNSTGGAGGELARGRRAPAATAHRWASKAGLSLRPDLRCT